MCWFKEQRKSFEWPTLFARRARPGRGPYLPGRDDVIPARQEVGLDLAGDDLGMTQDESPALSQTIVPPGRIYDGIERLRARPRALDVSNAARQRLRQALGIEGGDPLEHHLERQVGPERARRRREHDRPVR